VSVLDKSSPEIQFLSFSFVFGIQVVEGVHAEFSWLLVNPGGQGYGVVMVDSIGRIFMLIFFPLQGSISSSKSSRAL
jgi:hypothetical protein